MKKQKSYEFLVKTNSTKNLQLKLYIPIANGKKPTANLTKNLTLTTKNLTFTTKNYF